MNSNLDKISGHLASINVQILDSWIERHRNLILSYDRKDVYNADETGLYWRKDLDFTLTM